MRLSGAWEPLAHAPPLPRIPQDGIFKLKKILEGDKSEVSGAGEWRQAAGGGAGRAAAGSLATLHALTPPRNL